MTKLINISRLAKLTAVLAASVCTDELGVTVAVNPAVASAPTKPKSGTNNGPPGVTATDTLKDLGKTACKGLATVAVRLVAVVGGVRLTVGGALVGLAEGHPIKTTKEVAGEICSDIV